MKKQSLLNLISKSGNNLIFNKNVAEKISLEAAVILAELISEYTLWERKNALEEDGWFFCTVDKLNNILHKKQDVQNKHINKLISFGLIEKELRGYPYKRYFKLNIKNIIDFYNN